jgi:hypothetical protein
MSTFGGNNSLDYIKPIINDLLKQKEDLILEQLGELITGKLLEIQETQPVLIQDYMSNKIVLRQAVKLHFKGYERIQELEKENEELKTQLKNILGLKERLS